jgi:lysyl-tRNA synthetase class 2
MYLGGIELCNAFGELTDPVEQRARFEATAAARRAMGATAYPLDEDFLAALESGMPPSGGAALGVDRLCMALLDRADITAVRAFCER